MSGSTFTANITGFRQIRTRMGDTLKSIAVRELQDASKWTLLADLNGLVYPYIVSTLAEVVTGTILAGQPLKIPATATAASGVSATDDVYGVDLKLTQGRLTASATGDFQTISGADNLTQALRNRLGTKPGDLVYHLEYGCEIFELLGQGVNEGDDILAQTFVAKAINSDPRVSSTSSVTATGTGDAIEVSATAVAVTGQAVPTGITTASTGGAT